MFNIISSFIVTTLTVYFYLRFIRPLRITPRIKIFFFAFIAIGAQIILFNFLPLDLPDWLLLIAAWFLIVVCLSATLTFIVDMCAILLRVFKVTMTSQKYMPVLLLVSCILCTYGLYEGLRVPPVREITLSFEKLPGELVGKRIAVVADPQIGRFFRKERLDAAFDALLAAKPDMIAIVGDAVDAPLEEIKNDVLPFSRLQAPFGVYFVAGNHEYLNDYPQWIEYFRSLPNITVLENAHKNISLGKSTLSIIGLTDREAEEEMLPPPNAEEALMSFAPEHDTVFRLLLSHRPAERENAAVKADLQLSGHTHGGVIWPFQSIIGNINGGYVSGVYTTPTGTLFVSNGMGVWDGFPLRLGVPSEMNIITLEKI